METIKTPGIKNWKSAAIVFILSAFAFPAAGQAHYKSTMFGLYNNHHYVYYPKQNFYYDPYAYNYVVVEDGIWVRQVEPPSAFAEININVLPHVDVHVDSYQPYQDNKRHKHKYRLVRYMSPSNDFYVSVFPLRFDFSITPYQYYRPAEHVVFVNYNPNLYYHPGRGHAYGHGKHPNFHNHGNHNNYYRDNHGPKGHGNSNHGNNHNPGDFHQKGKQPNGSGNWGKKPDQNHNNNKRPGDFHQNKGNDRGPGDFHQKNAPEKNQPKQQTQRKPGDFHSKGGQPSGPAKGGKGPGKKGGH